mgnify:CR=1 FL=1
MNESAPAQLKDEELHLYSRHILLNEWDIDAQQNLKNSHVLIIGAGGLGCTSSEMLVRAGVGKITIIDFDKIELSNIQRQIAFDPYQIGQQKVEVLTQHLKSINPLVEVTAINEKFDQALSEQLKDDFDLVLDGCDNFATRYAVNQFCVERKIPLLTAAAIGLEGQLMMLKSKPCYHCVFPQSSNENPDERRCANSGVLTTTPAVMASLQAHHALLYLGLGHSPLLNKLLLWDGTNMQQRIVKVSADASCIVCGKV